MSGHTCSHPVGIHPCVMLRGFLFQMQAVQTGEKGVFVFKIEALQFRLSLNPMNLQTLQLNAAPCAGFEASWDADDIAALEKFFETKVHKVSPNFAPPKC